MLVISFDAVFAALVHNTKIKLRGRIPLVRRLAEIGQCQFEIPHDAETVLIHGAKLVLGGSVALIGGFAIPRQRLRVFQRRVARLKIIIRQDELRAGITGSGRREK